MFGSICTPITYLETSPKPTHIKPISRNWWLLCKVSNIDNNNRLSARRLFGLLKMAWQLVADARSVLPFIEVVSNCHSLDAFKPNDDTESYWEDVRNTLFTFYLKNINEKMFRFRNRFKLFKFNYLRFLFYRMPNIKTLNEIYILTIPSTVVREKK